MTTNNWKICHIELDGRSIIRRSADIDHERRVAIFDLLEENYFEPVQPLPDDYAGPFHISLSMVENRLAIDLKTPESHDLFSIQLSLTPFKRIIKQYFTICDSYFSAIKTASPRQIEAIDLGRRGLHNDGSELLIERLEQKVKIDFNTARRLFTLICVLQIR